MKKEVFDILAAINAQSDEHFQQTGQIPQSVSVSRNAYRRLLEINIDESSRNGNPTDRCEAILEMPVATGRVKLYIDELIGDTEISIE
jgi:hypothetical protein